MEPRQYKNTRCNNLLDCLYHKGKVVITVEHYGKT